MANHKSALKRQRQSEARRARNRANKTRIKNVAREVSEAIDAKTGEGAQAALRKAIPVICKAATKGTIHKKNASRKVSRLTRRVNASLKTAEQSA